jgi:hypothetical protein
MDPDFGSEPADLPRHKAARKAYSSWFYGLEPVGYGSLAGIPHSGDVR